MYLSLTAGKGVIRKEGANLVLIMYENMNRDQCYITEKERQDVKRKTEMNEYSSRN